jgi:hypothetical protein
LDKAASGEWNEDDIESKYTEFTGTYANNEAYVEAKLKDEERQEI